MSGYAFRISAKEYASDPSHFYKVTGIETTDPLNFPNYVRRNDRIDEVVLINRLDSAWDHGSNPYHGFNSSEKLLVYLNFANKKKLFSFTASFTRTEGIVFDAMARYFACSTSFQRKKIILI